MSLHHINPRFRISTKLSIITVFLVLFAGLGYLIMSNLHANASVNDWDPGNIMSDSVFTNKNSLSTQDIQNFLNAKVPVCDTGGTLPATEFLGANTTTTHAQYAAIQGWPAPPYPCLRDYIDNGLSAAQIIYNLSQQYQINPQVFLVLLQKEEGLVGDTWPLPSQYRTATGYGCPDTAACDSKYYGLTAQLTWSATMFHAIATNNPVWSNVYGSGTSWYSPYILGNNTIAYNPNSSCGSSIVNIQNRATQALYDYTTYQPNTATINWKLGNGPSVSSAYPSCGAFGNINFYSYFTNWFGSTQRPINCTGTETQGTFVSSFYNPRTYEHFYTAFDCDTNFLLRLGYIKEGAVFNTTPSTVSWAVPIYRYYNPSTGLHVWSPILSTPAELLASKTGYQQEAGIVFYVARSDMPNVTQIESYYNPKTYQHVFGLSLNPQMASVLLNTTGYSVEGPVFSTQ